jgi:hypothetical protein
LQTRTLVQSLHANTQHSPSSRVGSAGRRAAGSGGDSGATWSQLQVGCNVSVAGNDTEGGAWWVFHCGLISPSGTNVPGLTVRAGQASAVSTPDSSSSSRTHAGRSSSAGRALIASMAVAGQSGGRSPTRRSTPPEPPGPPGPDPPSPDPDPDPGRGSGYATCGPAVQGPLLVVVLERVQSGLLGAALSAFGITGLYFSVVFGESLQLSCCAASGCTWWADRHWLYRWC